MPSEKIRPQLVAAIVATGLMSFAGVVSETAMNVTFPTLMRAFAIDTAAVQWLTTGYLLALALVVPLSSFFKRRFPLKALFLCANLLFLAATLLCALHRISRCCSAGACCRGRRPGLPCR